jgi:uncharacterized lipoprotein YehR (DUF1307 family)
MELLQVSMNRTVLYELHTLYQQLEEVEERLMTADDAASRWQAGIDYDKIQAAIADLKESVFT